MVTVYTKNNCPKCTMTKNVLNGEGIKYKAINIETEMEEDEREVKLQEFRDLGFMSMPVVFPADGDPFSDFQPEKLKGLK